MVGGVAIQSFANQAVKNGTVDRKSQNLSMQHSPFSWAVQIGFHLVPGKDQFKVQLQPSSTVASFWAFSHRVSFTEWAPIGMQSNA